MRNRLLIAVVALGCVACTNTIGDDSVPEDEPRTASLEPGLCEDSDDCGEAELCFGGQCQPVAPGGCTTKAECGAGDVCVDGACTVPPADCGSSEHCPGAQVCDGFTRSCFDPIATGCLSDADCALEPECANGCSCDATGGCMALGSDPEPTDPEPTDPEPTDPEPTDPEPTDPDPPAPTGDALSLSGYVLENREHSPPSQVGVLPAGTELEPGQRLIVSRDADRAAFEAHWEVTLGPDVVFLNAEAGNSGVPIVNGGEKWALVSPVGTDIDGETITGSTDSAYTRTQMTSAGSASAWAELAADLATPGVVDLPTTGVGLVISEWADAPGTGNYIYEYVELYYAP